ncbi:hypothetical protein SO802_019861 [Lithocarpus litseifolius]|uniref:Uncharacterized protein n=1 Tax=Lithocarpus litseifolius TaxID=425828 RepID=A0AAW2CR10_9ROSI
MERESLEVSPQALDHTNREPLKEANNWSSELSMSSNVLLFRSLQRHHIKHNGAKFQMLDECSPSQFRQPKSVAWQATSAEARRAAWRVASGVSGGQQRWSQRRGELLGEWMRRAASKRQRRAAGKRRRQGGRKCFQDVGIEPETEASNVSICKLPWSAEAILVGFQHYLVVIGSIVIIISTIIVPLMGRGNAEKAEVINTFLFVAGINTLLQTAFGTRLPVVTGPSYAFSIPIISIALSRRFSDYVEPHERFKQIMRAIQGALIVSSFFQMVVGFFGFWRIFARFLSPLAAVPFVTLTGVGLFVHGFPQLAKCIEVGLPELIILIVLSRYIPSVLKSNKVIFVRYAVVLSVVIVWVYADILNVAGAYNRRSVKTQLSCRTDCSGLISAASWRAIQLIRVPYPFQWGRPTFNAGDAFAMMASGFVAIVESTGTYIAAARYGSATHVPPSVLSRGVGWQGIGTFLDGIFGAGSGSIASVENAGLLGLTQIGSRRVVQISAGFMIFFSDLGKFGAVIASIPLPIVAALYWVLFAYVVLSSSIFLLLLFILHSPSMDEVTKQWEKLTLTDLEGEECALKKDVVDGSFAVVARFLTKRKINLEAVARTFQVAWRADGDFEFRDLGNNRALIVFTDEVDMNRVILQSPWSFDKYLMAFHKLGENECINSVSCDKAYFWVQISNLPSRHMTKENGERIGSTLGEVNSVDSPNGGRAWGTYVQVRVNMDITKPLCRGRMVHLGASDRRWVSFQYERLPIYCYWCGKLDHDEKDCRIWIPSNGSLSWDAQQYGPWLQASSDRLQKPQVVRVRGRDTQKGDRGSAKSASVRSTETVQGQNTMGPMVPICNQDPVFSGNIAPFDFSLQFKKNSIPADFEAQIREIDKELERKVLKEPYSAEGVLVFLALQSNVLGSKSNGADVTPLCGPTQFGPLIEVDKATPVFVLGSGDVTSEALNPTRRNIQGTTAKHVSKEVVMGDQNDDTRRKLDDIENTKEAKTLVAKRSKLEDAVYLGKVFKEQFGLAEIVQAEAPSLVFLMETKLPLRAKNRMSNIKNFLGLTQGLVVPSEEKSGGLALLWKPNVKVDVQSSSRWHIDAVIDSGGSNGKWRLRGFYGNLDTRGRPDSWARLSQLVAERIDRAFATTEWLNMFPGARLHHLASSAFDHCCLMLRTNQRFQWRKMKKLVRFESMWLKDGRCGDIVKESWAEGELMGRGNIFSSCKISGDVKHLRGMQIEGKGQSLVGFGGANVETKANNRKQRNTILGVMDESENWHENEEKIAEIITEYYQKLFTTSQPVICPEFLDAIQTSVTPQMNHMLTKVFTATKVKKALDQMYPLKSPGPDGRNPSYVWRCLLAAQSIVNQGMRWQVGDGKNIRIWKDKWIPTPSTYRVISPRTLLPEEATADILIDADHGTRRADLVRELFLDFEAENILSIPLSTRMPRDKLVWAGTANGQFTVKSAYWLAMSMSRGAQEAVWAACGLVVDRDRAFVDLLWKLRSDSGPAGVNFTHFMAIAWNIWRNRNGVCHGEASKTVQKMILEATQLVTEYQALQDCPISTNNTLPTQWSPPVSGVFKANADGAVFNDLSSVGIGLVLRDDNGHVAGALSQKIYAPLGPLGAKAKAMEATMLFARDMGIQDIEFEGGFTTSLQFFEGVFFSPT